MIFLFIGDSILEGMTDEIMDQYLARREAGRVVVLAETGWSTRRWLRDGHLGEQAREIRPDVVVICLGTNDEGEERNPENYQQAVDRLRTDASQTGATVLWVTAFSGSGTAERYRLVREIVGAQRTINGRGLMSGVEMAGEIHPTIAGYRTLARNLLSEVWGRVASSSGAGTSAGGGSVVPLVVGAGLALLGAWIWWR